MNCKKFESLIEDYLTGKLDESLMESFEQHYFECDNCFTSVRTEKILLKKQFTVNIKEKSVNAPIRMPRWTWGVAAACLILLVSIPFFFQVGENQLMEKLSQFEPPIYFQSETRNIDVSPVFKEAMKLYQKKEFNSAVQSLNQLLDETFNPQIHFYKGICLLMTGNPNSAVEEFDRIITQMDPSYFDEAIYYKGIAYLRMGKKNRAVRQFKKLADMFSPFKTKAQNILDQLK